MVATSLRDAYEARLRDGWEEDSAQASAVSAMNGVLVALAGPGNRRIKGLYLHGPVGRGKTQLLDMFMERVAPARARRTHMHAFMLEVHQRLHEIKAGDPVIQIAREMADAYRVLGFDEFYVSNIADGMLLGRLFEHLFKYGVVVVATSNWPMDELYRGGHNRKGFLPFIRVLERNMQAIDLGDGQDYRQIESGDWPLYVLTPQGTSRTAPELERLFEKYAAPGTGFEPPAGIRAKAFSGRCAWYEFSELCERPLGRADYLELVSRLDTLIIEGIPAFARGQADPVLRLVTLIDLCYEHKCRVIVSAAGYPEELYVDGPVLTAFQRVASRLAEMQGWE